MPKAMSNPAQQPAAPSKSESTTKSDSTSSSDEPDEWVKALKYSPPLFVAWAVGYLSEWTLLLTLSVMLMPLLRDKAVEALGGKGAFVKVSAPPPTAKNGKQKGGAAAKHSAEPSTLETVLDVLRVPMSVWLPPVAVCTVFRSEDDLEYVLTLGTVYSVMVFGQAVMRKLGLDPRDRKSKKA